MREKPSNQDLKEWATSREAKYFISTLDAIVFDITEDVMSGGTLREEMGATDLETMRAISFANGLKEAMYQMELLKEESDESDGLQGISKAH